MPLDYWLAVWQRERLRLLWSDPGVHSRSVAAEAAEGDTNLLSITSTSFSGVRLLSCLLFFLCPLFFVLTRDALHLVCTKPHSFISSVWLLNFCSHWLLLAWRPTQALKKRRGYFETLETHRENCVNRAKVQTDICMPRHVRLVFCSRK